MPGSYTGYKALFGAKYVEPGDHRRPAGCVKATDGTNITDPARQLRLPRLRRGARQEHARLRRADAGERRPGDVRVHLGRARQPRARTRRRGPGEADYQQQLAAYDQAFATFFQRLQHTASTRQHAVRRHGRRGRPLRRRHRHARPAEPGRARLQPHRPCSTPTACPSNQIGEVNVNINSALPAGRADVRHPLRRRPDVLRQRPAGADEPGGAQARAGRRSRHAARPVQGRGADVPIAVRLADTVEEKALHMVNTDPKRTPTFTMFGERRLLLPDGERLQGRVADPESPSASTRRSPGTTATPGRDRQHVVGMVGPGVAQRGVDSTTWTDHVDLRPTINALLGLAGQLPRRRPRRHARSLDKRRRCRGRSPTAGDHEQLGDVVQADQRAVRAVRDGHARPRRRRR